MSDPTKIVGVITGKFAPLHAGHIKTIITASTQVDELYVVLSFDSKFLSLQSPRMQRILTKKNRLLWLKHTFRDMQHIHIVCVDESDVEPYPSGAKDWSNLVRKETNHVNIDKWFSSEPDYTVWINEFFPEAEHVLVDPERSQHNISATMIRQDPVKHWEFMPTIVRKAFLLKVCFIGLESTGKTTLTRYMAKVFNTSWVEEYGRTYCETDMVGDESLLRYSDYGKIAAIRYQMELDAEATSNRVLFCDTNAFVTQFYCNMYERRIHPLVDGFIESENYDMIIHLESDVPWVDDGLRSNPDRMRTGANFNWMLRNYGIDQNMHGMYHKVSGDYHQRLNKCVELVRNLLGEI